MVKTYNLDQLLDMKLPVGTILITNGFTHYADGWRYQYKHRTLLQVKESKILTLNCKDLTTGNHIKISQMTAGLM